MSILISLNSPLAVAHAERGESTKTVIVVFNVLVCVAAGSDKYVSRYAAPS